MNRRHTLLELIVFSFLFLSLSIGALLVVERGFPEGFKAITGQVVAHVNITAPTPSSCNFTIQPGWNLLSFFCITTMEDVDEFLTEDGSDLSGFTAIFTYRGSDSIDPWKVYRDDLPSWVVNDLDYFSRKEGYYIYFNISESSNVFINGSKRIPTNIELYSGWNLVGYPTDEEEDLLTAIASINDTYLAIYEYNTTYDNYTYYISGTGGSLNTTKPYRGYWINMSSADNWVIDW